MDHELSRAHEPLLRRVERPARYLGNERGAVRKSGRGIRLRFALAFPDVYEVAQSHLGLQILYHILNRRPDVAAERVYAPWPDLEDELRRRGLPLASLETRTPLSAFDIVGFSLQYELSYTNLLTMLELGRIPLHAAARGPGDPVVIAGGPAAYNPEPVADFLDAVLLGDGEEAIGEICDVVIATGRRDRGALLRALASIPGIYVPSRFRPRYDRRGRFEGTWPLDDGQPPRVRRRVVCDLEAVPAPTAPVVPNVAIVHDRACIEVMRGCLNGCRFCQAGYVYRPLRERDPRTLTAQATAVVERTGYQELSLLSLSTADYSAIEPLLRALAEELTPRHVALSLPSTRVEALSPSLLRELAQVRTTAITLAPEAGTQRLRDVIQKKYREEELLAAAGLFAELGWRSLKLYFMIGLPTETEEDVLAIAELTRRVAAAGRGRLRVTASVSTFVPKPHTPFQWERELSIPETEHRQELLRRALTRYRLGFRWHDPWASFLEGVFSRGDRRLAPVLLVAQQLGCRFDGWSERRRPDLWLRAFAACGIDPVTYLRARELEEPLPWDHLDAGPTTSFLQRERRRALAGLPTPNCATERCTSCGACDFEHVRNVTYMRHGARGSEHRGPALGAWASEQVPHPLPLPKRAAAGPGAVCRLRLRYAKVGPARLLGGREVARAFTHAVIRARLPVAWSQGHHPLPRLSFGPALPLGYESLAETLEGELAERVDPASAARRLAAELPEGLYVLAAELVPCGAPRIETAESAVRYRVRCPGVSEERLAAAVADFLAASTYPLARRRGKSKRAVDARAQVREIVLAGADTVELEIQPGTAVRPDELVASLLGASRPPRELLQTTKLAVRCPAEPGLRAGARFEQPTVP